MTALGSTIEKHTHSPAPMLHIIPKNVAVELLWGLFLLVFLSMLETESARVTAGHPQNCFTALFLGWVHATQDHSRGHQESSINMAIWS